MIKIVLVADDGMQVIAKGCTDQGIDQDRIATSLFATILSQAGLRRSLVRRVVATGYGRARISLADTTITEITCQAVAIHRLLPEARTVIDIGGQDSKIIRLADSGRVFDFVMNDRCAAGTGRFLEVVADRLGVDLVDLGPLAATSREPAVISSMCVVFAETEIIGLLAANRPREDIVAGVQRAIAQRIHGMAGRTMRGPVVFTGGVALVAGMQSALEDALGLQVVIPQEPHMTAAFGAAILARDIQQGGHYFLGGQP